MYWLDLINSISVFQRGGKGNPEVLDIAHDSRLVIPGAVFVAIPGYKTHGDTFIDAAIKKGAVGVVSENRQTNYHVPWVQVENPRQILSILSKNLWRIDFDAMVTVGITGTNGKTTTASLYHNLYRSLYGHDASWMFSTVVYELGNVTKEANHTTPEGSDLLRFIGKANTKPRAVVMEVSSHALALHRVEGFLFDIAVWTNLTQDHLDFHEDMESYYNVKKQLFTYNLKENGVAVINIDDPWGMKLSNQLSNISQITYGFSDKADVKIIEIKNTWEGTELEIVYNNKSMHFNSQLVGFFNGYNMGALIAGALKVGISEKEIQKSFLFLNMVPGRMERIPINAKFSVVVDYAHTPDALENVLSTTKKLTSGNLICVFGCGGDRDRSKRSLMAESVVRGCDEAIITSDNPRTESPQKIIEDIVKGIPLDFPHRIIPDRREAIKAALQIAQKDDCIVIAGKGHENYQEIQGIRHHFDDREIVLELHKEMRASSEKK